ncbi:MAG: hypothetical protein ACW99Q_29150, partial [Candidatus Kariarchaeaceae archaeon]
MVRFKENHFFIMLAAFVFLSGIAIFNLSLRPALPFKSSPQGLILENKAARILPDTNGDSLISKVDHIPVQTNNEVDEIVDRKRIGNQIQVTFLSGKIQPITLIPRYSWGYL